MGNSVRQSLLREMQQGDVIIFPAYDIQAAMNSVTTTECHTGAKFQQRKVVCIDMKADTNLIRGIRVECMEPARPRKQRGRPAKRKVIDPQPGT